MHDMIQEEAALTHTEFKYHIPSYYTTILHNDETKKNFGSCLLSKTKKLLMLYTSKHNNL